MKTKLAASTTGEGTDEPCGQGQHDYFQIADYTLVTVGARDPVIPKQSTLFCRKCARIKIVPSTR